MTWNWINHDGQRLYDVGVLPDGKLHNPNGYDEAVVREAIRRVTERDHMRRSQAAKQAAITRERRQKARVYAAAKKIVAEQQCGPQQHCCICSKLLLDSESIARGIGSDCWQKVLEAISKLAASSPTQAA